MSFTIRSIDDIFQQLLAEKQTFSTLDGLTDNGITDESTLIPLLDSGKAPEWVLWLYNTAVSANLTDIATQSGIDDIQLLFDESKVPTTAWYITKAKEFQFGDTVIIDPITYKVSYATVDEEKQIIGSATTSEIQNRLTLKVRRKDTNLLTVDEKDAFVSYMQKVKAAGTQLVVENFDGDKLTLNMDIVYDPSFDINVVRSSVEAAINEYINNLGFDSRFITNTLTDRLQEIAGVIDPRFNDGVALDALGNEITFRFEYLTNAGWAQVNPDTPLIDTLNFIVR